MFFSFYFISHSLSLYLSLPKSLPLSLSPLYLHTLFHISLTHPTIAASQYRRLKTEWKLNVLLRRSGIQGLGLYARRFIERNTMVIEYVGQLIRTALCDLREIYYNSKNIGCYMFKIDDVVAIDATMTGGPAR